MEHLLIDTGFTVAAAIKMYFLFGLSLNKKDQEMRIEEKVNEYFSTHQVAKTRSSINLLKWIYNDAFETLQMVCSFLSGVVQSAL